MPKVRSNKDYFEQRILEIADWYVVNQSTVRETAKHFKISKSTVHKYLKNHLKNLNYPLYLECQKLLKKNLEERHIRGGISTKLKYKGGFNI